MSDLIDRQAVIDLLKQMRKDGDMVPWEGKDVFARIRKLPTVQPEKAQLSQEGTTKDATSDLISKTEVVEHLRRMLEATVLNTDYDEGFVDGVEFGVSTVSTMPTIQPQSTAGQLNDSAQSTAQSTDLIDRQAALDIFDDYNVSVENGELEAYSRDRKRLCELQSVQPVATDINAGDKISKFIDGLEVIFADLRERHVDDSVCGLCEYDGAYMGQSGDWCNECPGFDRDDCFKLSDETRKKWTDEIIKALPTVQPERTEERTETHGVCLDAISRQAAIDALDCISGVEEVLRSLPTIQPERKKGEWIEISSINHTYKCSECGRLLVNITDGRNNVSKHYPYCHCGADMRGERQK